MNNVLESAKGIFSKHAMHFYLTEYMLVLVAMLIPQTLKSALQFLYKLLPQFIMNYFEMMNISVEEILSAYITISLILCITSLWITLNFFYFQQINTVMHDIHYFFLYLHGAFTFALFLYIKLFLNQSQLTHYVETQPFQIQTLAVIGAFIVQIWIFSLMVLARFSLNKADK
ncbi:hypothetical protein HCJ19_09050 [Listeria seeligeri]|uniref:hypothetical protein n=1 Tax=Listeria seeligeri TaxID=1640 RepID=UPI00162ACF19|nr:hypothetical protein [Listeria seeligeri]EAG3410069.1 hypothetical protein [Listeria monocytogenes]EAG4636602.1 hypothetical protein [Listeria monocytogenes]EAH4084472.1 hypothetical protein [Listeria monocytogenes]EEO9180088.1 hypothetical protein [Listeria monocytogenes]EIF6131971.1 hypothetical protein [Listeria monocytogenes]